MPSDCWQPRALSLAAERRQTVLTTIVDAAQAAPVPGVLQASISARLASHVSTTRWEDLPQDAISAAKRLALDTLAVAWPGSEAPGVPESSALLVEQGGKPESVLWAGTQRVPARFAAFVNSAAAAALDYDGMRATERGSVHADSVVLPAAWAVAERQHASGREFLTAVILGNDIVTRLGAASALPHKGWYHTSIYGIFGAAAAASKLLALSPEQTAHAFGIALSQTAATQLPNISRSLAKRLSSAFAAHAGVFSALLAARGITAPRLAFEGAFGFYQLYQDGEPERLFAGLGQEYPHTQTAIKKYPTCACNHTAIEATLGLVRDHGLVAGDIERVEVTISPYVDRLVGAPFDPGSDPQVAAQFSVQYSVAVAILRGRFSVLDIENAAVLDQAVGALARAVRVTVEPAWGNRRCAHVAITSRRHGVLAKHVELIPGGPGVPLAHTELVEKTRSCLGSGRAALAGDAIDGLVARLDAVEKVADMARFFDGIV